MVPQVATTGKIASAGRYVSPPLSFLPVPNQREHSYSEDALLICIAGRQGKFEVEPSHTLTGSD